MSLIFLLVACTTDGPPAVDKPAPEPVPVAPVPETTPAPVPTTVPVPTTEPVVPWDCTQARLTAAWELGSGGDQEMNLLAPMPGGDMIVVGNIDGDVDFGHGVMVHSFAGDDLVVARIQPDGVPVWAVLFRGGRIIPEGVAVDATGRIAVAGSFSVDLVLDQGTPSEATYKSADGSAGFVAVLSPTGVHEWVRTVDYDGVGLESFDAVAFDAGGVLWAAGTYDGFGASVSFGQPDAVALGGDSNLNYDDAFLARYDPAGALLGLAWSNAEYTQAALHVAPRPTGGVDLMLAHWDEPTPIMDMGGTLVELPGGPSSKSIVRFDAVGKVEDSLGLEIHAANGLGYVTTDLLLLAFMTVPATVAPWDGSAAQEVPDSGNTGFNGFLTWTDGVAPVMSELLHPYSTALTGYVSPLGKAVGARSGGDINVLPDTSKLEILESESYADGAARPYAVAWDPTGHFVCGVDIETSGYHDVPFVVHAVALDEAGGLWLAGEYQEETFTYESYEGGPAVATLTAGNGEETQGFLARWQLWPGPASPVPVPVPAP